MDPSHLQLLFEYTAWANRRVWECIESLDEADFARELPGGRSSLRDQCAHILGVEHWWPHYLATGVLDFIQDRERTTREAMRVEWDRIEANNRAYLATVTTADLSRMVSPEVWGGELEVEAWQALMQVINHSTDHRAQILADIRGLGGETVEQDLLGYLYERSESLKHGDPPRA